MAAVAQNSKSCASHRRPTPCISALYGESRMAKHTLESGGSAPPIDLALYRGFVWVVISDTARTKRLSK